MVSTADVRPIGEVVDELRKLLARRLPGNRTTMAAWTAVNEAARIFEHARFCLAEEEKYPKERHPVLSNRVWEYHGHAYAATTIIRRVADEMGVANLGRKGVRDATLGADLGNQPEEAS